MTFGFNWPDYLVFALWLLLYTLIGVYHRFRRQIWSKANELLFHRRGNTERSPKDEDIFLGDRNLTLFPILSSVMASFLSAVSLMGTAAEAYCFGIQFIFMMFAYAIGFSLAAEVYLPVFYKLHLNSAHEYLELRFGKSVRWLTSLIFCIQMVIYTSLALYAPAMAFSQVSGLPVWLSLLSTGLVGTFYTALGGIRAVVWTDVVQLLVLTIGLLLVVILGTIKVGGVRHVWKIALEGRRLDTFSFDPNPFLRHTFWTLVIGGGGMVLSIYGSNQTQVQRYMACRTLRTARLAVLLNIPMNAVFLVIQISAGLVAYAYFAGCDPVLDGKVTAYDQILPYVVMVLFDGVPVIRGLFLSVIFAAALSSVSSGINSLANVCLEDLIRPLYISHQKQDLSDRAKFYSAVSLSAVIGLSTVGTAFLFTVTSPRILQLSFSLFGAVGGPILAVFTLGMILPWINWQGGLAGLLASTVFGLWMSVEAILNPIKNPRLPLSTSNCTDPPSVNVTSAQLPSEWSLYSLSYLYYTLACLVVGILAGTLVSALFGWNTGRPVPEKLLAWQASAFYRHFPEWLPTQIIYTKNDEPKTISIRNAEAFVDQ